MARPRKFDADAAVEAATETFWTTGHTTTSTEMLRGSVSDQLRDP
jgi:TetR/AcrR family transcriptional regulator, transcriptional repressor for nem operon